MNAIQGTTLEILQCNWIIYEVVTTRKYHNITVDNIIHIKEFYDVTMSYPIIYTDDDLNNYNNETSTPELIKVFEEEFEIKFKEISVLKYFNFRVCQSPLGVGIYQTNPII